MTNGGASTPTRRCAIATELDMFSPTVTSSLDPTDSVVSRRDVAHDDRPTACTAQLGCIKDVGKMPFVSPGFRILLPRQCRHEASNFLPVNLFEAEAPVLQQRLRLNRA